MKTKFFALQCPIVIGLLFFGHTVLAQSNPRLDPAFRPTELYRPAAANQIRQLTNGARLILDSNFSLTRAEGQPASGLVRYTPAGSFDAAFSAQVATYDWQPTLVVEQPDAKLLVASFQTQIGATTRATIIRLNADGTPDFTLNVGAITTGLINDLVVQADGKILLAGSFTQIGNQTVNRLVRLNSDGSFDAAFRALNTGTDGPVRALSLQTDGKILVAGDFNSITGRTAPTIARLNADGSFDGSFNAQSPSSSLAVGIALQPDGNVLVLAGTAAGITGGAGANRRLVRLLPTGALDASFTGGQSSVLGFATRSYQPVQALPNGSILVSTTGRTSTQTPVSQLVRINSAGVVDASFQFSAAELTPNRTPPAYQALATGQVLVASEPIRYSNGPIQRLAVVLLAPSGTLDGSFRPLLEQPGIVHALARQTDGNILVGGNFSSFNGTVANNIARVLPSGLLDVTYTQQAQANGNVYDLALQPNGLLLVAGEFDAIGGGNRTGLSRLLTNGQADVGFSASLALTSSVAAIPAVRKIALQPNGSVFAAGIFRRTAGPLAENFVSILPNGQADVNFQPAADLTTGTITCLLVQPDGNVLVGTYDFVPLSATSPVAPRLQRLLANGTADQSFAPLPGALPGSFAGVSALALDANGRVLADDFSVLATSTTATTFIQRLLPNGVPDTSFSTTAGLNLTGNSEVNAITVQPNGRILLGGFLNVGSTTFYSGCARLLANGSVDTSFDLNQSPDITANDIVVQPDGALVIGGDFTTVSGLPVMGLTRLLDSNVLSIKRVAQNVQVIAWPNPAHDLLHLEIGEGYLPQQLQLIDVLGRVVLTKTITQPKFDVVTSRLSSGVYLLRIKTAMGHLPSQRIVIE